MLALLETSTQAADSKFSDTAFAITVLILFSVLFIYIIAGAAFEHFKVTTSLKLSFSSFLY